MKTKQILLATRDDPYEQAKAVGGAEGQIIC